MVNMYSTPWERAKDEYWLNQDRIPMDTEERYRRHRADIEFAKVEQLERLNDFLEGQAESSFLKELWSVAS